MKKVTFTLLLLLSIGKCFAQLELNLSPSLYANFEDEASVSFNYSAGFGYNFDKFHAGFEYVKSTYRNAPSYHLKQYQFVGRYYPLDLRDWYIKCGGNISEENYNYIINSRTEKIKIDENGILAGFEAGVGYEYYLIKKINLLFNTSLTYNYLHVLKDNYFFNSSRTPLPFWALKIGVIYRFKKKE